MSDDTQKFVFETGETYDDIPSGDYGPLTNIGHASAFRAYKVWVPGDTTDEGEYTDGNPRILPRGFHYLDPADKDKALEYVKKYLGQEFVTLHSVIQMPVASVTNMADETRSKFTSGFIGSDCRVTGIPKDWNSPESKAKHYAGLNLVLIPSVVDAYARAFGWYKDPLFNPALVAGSEVQVDMMPTIEKLVAQRQAIWAELGEPPDNWRTSSVKELQSKKLTEAVLRTVNSKWATWIRLSRVFDPSPGAYYTKPDENGESQKQRNYCPVVLEMFPNERVATEIGQKELAEHATGGDTGSKSVVAPGGAVELWGHLSDKARQAYGDGATFLQVVPQIRQAIAAGRANPLVANEFSIANEDVDVVKGYSG